MAAGTGPNVHVTLSTAAAAASLNAFINQLNGFAARANAAFNQANAGLNKFAGNLKNQQKGVESFFGAFAKLAGMYTAIRAMEAFIARMIEVNRQYTGFVASMNVVRGSMSKATAEYEWLLAMSNKLGVSVESSITQYHRLAASMKNVDTTGEMTRHVFAGLSSAAVVLHSRGRDVSLIFEAVSQIASKGKLSLEELQRQLGNTLPGAVATMAKAMMQSDSFIAAGVKNAAEAERLLRKQIADGTINAYEAILRFSNQLKKEYGDGVKYAADQFQANFNRMKNSIFEFYRVVGNSSAMEGLTNIIRELTGLFNDGAGQGASGLGEALGGIFNNIADWLKDLDTHTVKEFFDTVAVSFETVGILVGEFFEAFSFLGSADMQTPLLDFAEFCARTMAAIVDIFVVAAAGIRAAMLGAIEVAYSAREAAYSVSDMAMKGSDAMPWLQSKGEKGRSAAYWDKRRNQQAQRAGNASALRGAERTFFNGPEGGNAYDRVTQRFGAVRQGLQAGKYGVPSASAPFYSLPQAGKPFYQMGTGTGKAGSTADAAAAYVNPLGNSELQKLLDQVNANSGAPNAGKGKGGGGGRGGGKSIGQRAEDLFMREQTKILKELAVAEVEYQNILDGKHPKLNREQSAMESLIKTDERYMALSDAKKGQLMAWAAQLDDIALKIENATKAQEYHNETLTRGYDVQSQLADLLSGGYVNQYRELIDLENSYKKGGENEFVDEANRMKMRSDAMKRDMDERLLDMAEYKAAVMQTNDEMEFQASLFGLSTLEQQKLTEFRKIDLWVQQMSVGATQEMILKYQELGRILREDVAESLQYVADKQNDVVSNLADSINQYMETTGNLGKNWATTFTNFMGNAEEALLTFVETGKLSFKDLVSSLIKDLAKLVIRYMLVFMLQKITGLSPGVGAGDATGGLFGMMNWITGPTNGFMAKGGVFGGGQQKYFAKGGVFDSPMMFPLAGGRSGVAFEKGPEAIMPLAKDRNGNLGVRMADGGGDGGVAVLNLTVEVYQGEGTGVRTEMGKNENGDVLRVLVGEVAADIQRGGPVAKSINQTYGLTRKSKSYT